jgi:hypothetical protein
MEPNEKIEQRRVVVDSPGERREIVTERTVSAPRESGISASMVAIIAIVAVFAVGVIFYLVSSRNANESANRNANLDLASQTNKDQTPPTAIQQPAPVIIQQPAAQQAPVIIQQPAQANLRDTSGDDANMQEVATKRLTEEPGMASVSISISDAQAVLTGNVSSAVTKARAERLVRAVRGVKSVDNQIVVSSM